PVGHAGRLIHRGRPGGAEAAANDIRADDEEPVGINGLAWTYQRAPPARLAGDRMDAGHMLVAGKRVADEDCIRLVGIELATGLVGDLKARKLDAGIEAQWLVGTEAKDRAVGGIGLAGHVIRRLAGHQALLRDKKTGSQL